VGSNPAKEMDFKGDKNLQHTFLWMGSKAGGPMLQDFTACKGSLGGQID
jgi:hypothetical protein